MVVYAHKIYNKSNASCNCSILSKYVCFIQLCMLWMSWNKIWCCLSLFLFGICSICISIWPTQFCGNFHTWLWHPCPHWHAGLCHRHGVPCWSGLWAQECQGENCLQSSNWQQSLPLEQTFQSDLNPTFPLTQVSLSGDILSSLTMTPPPTL